MKKSVLVSSLSLVLATTTVLSTAGAATKTDTIVIRHTQLGEAKQQRLNILKDVLARVSKEVPGVKYKLDGVDSDVNRKEKLRSEMVVNKAPAIFDLFGGTDTQLYVEANRLLDLTPILKELGLSNKFISLDEFKVNGKVYGLPIGGYQEGYFYNKDYFKAHNLSVPKTLSELESLAATIKKDGKTPFAQASKAAWVPLMTANTLWSRYAGPDITNGFTTGKTKWNSTQMVAAFTKYQDWVKKGYFKQGELGLDYAEQRNQLIRGEAIMMYDGSWASSVFSDPKQAGSLTNKVGYFALPSVSGGKGSQTAVNGGFSNGYGFSSKVKNNKQQYAFVKSFIKNMYNDEMQIRGLEADGVLPSMKVSSSKLANAKVSGLVKEIIEVGNKASGAFPAFDSLVQPDVNTALSEGIQKLIAGKTTPKAMLDAVQKAQNAANSNEDF
ncbi:carbohydrate ABC transporter substrate-binding protein (CUT1 family) [Paenibacillus taihuensis]|uniref:Carbohydrate ABC transporter substrate-binding protein (CUT1 family) n=1 Tax=Paenibacillus taihuensis TaxID=1156355 RepID=A0A3D9RTZ0_9BACL|nr:extracellular solute-binding protein [Paenibacillus taihuensis]REE80165.1 carbohydrate ABC transporter substrate-binding protein (CUT1 family) [Paenibacillus taihuensis]